MGVRGSRNIGLFHAGDVVIVRRGKFAGKPFAVVGMRDDRVLIANGAEYEASKPKKKNVIHLQHTHFNLEDVAGRVTSGKPLDNGWLMQEISVVMNRDCASCKQEDGSAGWPKKR
ncbi:KOW domain-containing RNA-binding protein [Cloacibacillus sp. An23]|uniref:KOW domain-containing RNA-binding protein n=1 Tax=Cloacibacillus sp. An23 TaxID=1965591 RepID=UPI000B3ABDA1|nr:KOW domain-containing RNA-binding protein [Cloacibacillus sp. An23]OUO91169.1 hypothetical protein B5F39_13360 [Cloacibacillus sp. An23]